MSWLTDLLKFLLQRRLEAAAAVAVSSAIGVANGDTTAQQAGSALVGLLGAGSLIWSYCSASGPELYRRLAGGIGPLLYTLLGLLSGGAMPDADRATVTQAVLAAAGAALAIWSHVRANGLRPSRFASPNP